MAGEAIAQEPGMKPLLERVLAQREMLTEWAARLPSPIVPLRTGSLASAESL